MPLCWNICSTSFAVRTLIQQRCTGMKCPRFSARTLAHRGGHGHIVPHLRHIEDVGLRSAGKHRERRNTSNERATCTKQTVLSIGDRRSSAITLGNQSSLPPFVSGLVAASQLQQSAPTIACAVCLRWARAATCKQCAHESRSALSAKSSSETR